MPLPSIQTSYASYGEEYWIECPYCHHKTHVNTAEEYDKRSKTIVPQKRVAIICWFCGAIIAIVLISPKGDDDNAGK